MVEDFGDLHQRAWEALAAEEGKSMPPRWMLRRAEGMKNEQARCRPAPASACMLDWLGCTSSRSRAGHLGPFLKTPAPAFESHIVLAHFTENQRQP